jgi:hypothetical protein
MFFFWRVFTKRKKYIFIKKYEKKYIKKLLFKKTSIIKIIY